MNPSVRSQILERIKANYDAVEEGLDGFDFKFSTVEIGPLPDLSLRKINAVGIVVGRETKKDLFPYKDCTLPVAIEFRIYKNKGDAPSGVLAEIMLTAVTQVMYRDKNIHGLAMDIHETGSEIDLSNFADNGIAGVSFWDIRYRHKHDDPTSPYPSV